MYCVLKIMFTPFRNHNPRKTRREVRAIIERLLGSVNVEAPYHSRRIRGLNRISDSNPSMLTICSFELANELFWGYDPRMAPFREKDSNPFGAEREIVSLDGVRTLGNESSSDRLLPRGKDPCSFGYCG